MRKSEFIYTGEHADEQNLVLIPEDRDIFALLHPSRFHLLPGPWFEPFLKRKYKANLDNRLARLARSSKHKDGRPWLIRHKQELRISKDSVYQRHANTDAYMADNPKYKPDPFAHRLLEDMVQASIEIGVMNDPRYKIKRTEIERMNDVVPDGNVYQIQAVDRHLNYVKEIQRSRNNPKMREKLLGYKNLQKKKHEFKLQNLVTVFVCKNETDYHEILNIAAEIFPEGCSYIGFTYWCDPWSIKELIPKPTDTIFTRELVRIGHNPVHLSELWDK